ncbi:MAG: LptF/LptG family permease [Myxococcota bacterium]
MGRFGRHAAALMAVHVAIATLAGVCLYLVVDFVEVGNLAVERGEDDLIRLSLLNLPRVLRLMLPVAAPVGTISAISGLIRRRELIAMFGAGASPARVLWPTALVGLVIAALMVLNAELLVPPSAASVGAIRKRIGLGQSPLEGPGKRQSWFRGREYVYHVGSLADPRGRVAEGVLMLRLDQGRVRERWDLGTLERQEPQGWVGRDSVRRSFDAEEGLESVRQAETPVPVKEGPRDFVMSVAAPERLSILELIRTARARDRLGRPAGQHWLEIHKRFAAPASLWLVMALAAAITLRLGRRQTLARALGAGASLGASMWLLGDFTSLFGLSGTVSPWIAAWALPLGLVGAAWWAWTKALSLGVSE